MKSLHHELQLKAVAPRRAMLPAILTWLATFSVLLVVVKDGRAANLIFEDAFTNSVLNRDYWNPFVCDNATKGAPWHHQPGTAQGSSSLSGPNGIAAAYDLASFVTTSNGLKLAAQKGTTVSGYSWTGSALCSYPTTNASGLTRGFVFTNGYVEVRAKMPYSGNGAWPLIWFLPAPGSNGAEINLHEGGYLFGSVNPDRVMACNDNRNGLKLFDTGVSLSEDFHSYGLEYTQGKSIRMYFDDRLAAAYTNKVSTGGYFIILNNSVASEKTSDWHSKMDSFTPGSSCMEVAWVRVYDSRPVIETAR